MASIPLRFENKIDRLESGCWEWTGTKIWNGYGRIHIGGKLVLAHRAVYELLKGPILSGLTLDHLCRNRACVNPEHLEPVTMRENALRGEGPTAKNARKVFCIRGHLITGTKKSGNRFCVSCLKLRNTGTPCGRKPQTHCGKGHPLIAYGQEGRKFCRVCHRERARLKNAKT